MASERRVQVVMSWGGTPHGMVELRPGTRVVIGDAPGVSFLLPQEHVPAPIALVEGDETGAFVAHVPEGAIARADRGGLDPLAGTGGTRTLAIEPGTKLEIELGPFVFFVSETTAEATRAPLARPDLASMRWIGVSLAVHGLFLVSLLFMPPNAGALSLDLTGEQRTYIQTRLDAMQREQPPVEEIPEAGGGSEGMASAGDEGTAGAPEETRRTGGGLRVRGPSEDRRVPLTRESVVGSSVISTIQRMLQFDVTSPYGAADALGSAEESAFGALMANDSGFGPGTGGLGMQGVGRGGGCRPGQECGAGTIGVGALSGGGWGHGTTCTEEELRGIELARGHAAAMEACAAGGMGRATGTGLGGRQGRVPPRITCAEDANGDCGQVAGGLAREQIRRVISRNRSQVRHCYEQALAQRPDLAGRLTVRWSILPEGRVMGAQVGGANEIRNASVESCVVQAIGRWQFPSSPGATMVSYPSVFESTN